uniref:HSF-type DNA-binding domain-containing protein n=1 Tax=Chaetoceros debilis TaxID=122233 RepID=A0A7S3V525_9STRA
MIILRHGKYGVVPFDFSSMILTVMTQLTFIASELKRSEDGETFVVKDAEMLEREIIPSYFDHSKFSSFSRQLNFYGFRKVPQLAKDKTKNKTSSVRPVKFFHEFFKKGREELLCQIQRSTNRVKNKVGLAMNSTAMAEQDREINGLKNTVMTLEEKLASMKRQFESMENQMTLVLSMGSYGTWPSGQQQKGMNYQYVANNSNLIPNKHIHGSKPSTSTSYSDSTHRTEYSSSYQNKPGSAFYNTQTTYPLKSHIYQAPAPNSDAFKLDKNINSTPKRNSGAGNFDDTFDEKDSSRASTISPSSSTVGATLEPHPNVKNIADPIDLPPCPDFERGVSFLRGFSKDFEPIGI